MRSRRALLALAMVYAVAVGPATATMPVWGTSPSMMAIGNDDAPQQSNASPVGGLQHAANQFSVDINDTDFGVGDSVTVHFYIDGSKEGTDTLTSNGTASISHVVSQGGDHNWTAAANDSGGNWNNITYEFAVPNTLEIYNVTKPETKIDGRVVNVKLYADDQVFNNATQSGEIKFRGYPTDEPLVVELSATDYYDRTVIVDDIYSAQQAYMLNKTITHREVRYKLDDESGKFPREQSRLTIEKPLNRSQTTNWEVIASDYFGASGITVELELNERYRLTVQNEDGDSRSVGPYLTDINETVTLTPGTASVNLSENASTYRWGAEYKNESGTEKIVFQYNDTEGGEITDLNVTIYERGNESNRLYSNVKSGPVRNSTQSVILSNSEANKTWVVNWTASRNGETIGGKKTVGQTLRSQLDNLDDDWQVIFAVGTTVLIAGAFSRRNYLVGATIIPLVAGVFWYGGWLGGVTTASGIAFALGIVALYRAAVSGGGRL